MPGREAFGPLALRRAFVGERRGVRDERIMRRGGDDAVLRDDSDEDAMEMSDAARRDG